MDIVPVRTPPELDREPIAIVGFVLYIDVPPTVISNVKTVVAGATLTQKTGSFAIDIRHGKGIRIVRVLEVVKTVVSSDKAPPMVKGVVTPFILRVHPGDPSVKLSELLAIATDPEPVVSIFTGAPKIVVVADELPILTAPVPDADMFVAVLPELLILTVPSMVVDVEALPILLLPVQTPVPILVALAPYVFRFVVIPFMVNVLAL